MCQKLVNWISVYYESLQQVIKTYEPGILNRAESILNSMWKWRNISLAYQEPILSVVNC